MSAQPIWITPSGSLGTVPTGQYNQWPLQVTESDGSQVYFQVIAGALPSGIECTIDGVIQGVPTNVVTVAQETVTSNNIDVTSKFAIRAYTKHTINGVSVINRLADRTFTITVAGQNYPKWITGSDLGQFFDGSLLEPGIQLEYTTDNTTGIPPAISLVSGQLPPGLTVSGTGLISGFIGGNTQDPTAVQTDYEFSLQVTDGRTNAVQVFHMYVWNTSAFNASTTYITADNTYLTASISNIDIPGILNAQGSIGTALVSTYFAYKFNGVSINNQVLVYVGNNIPTGLTLDPASGWLYGYLPSVGLTEVTYDFTVRVYPLGYPDIISSPYSYSLTVDGPISTQVTWLSPANLGTIANGDTSLFYVKATSAANLQLQYRLVSGSNSSLPQGLTLLPSGNIVGRVSFNTFALDGGSTTIDNNTTTFDLTYTFTVNAYSINGYVSVDKTFTITVDRLYNTPYNNLYITCMPPQDDRYLIGSLLQNTSIFQPSLIYRADDPNFGVSTSVNYYHCYGLNAVNQNIYITALQLNHYWKNLILGPIKTAQAVDPTTGNVIYEVVYSEIVDNLVNNNGVSVGKNVELAYPIDVNTPQQTLEVFPNALVDMRNQVIDVIGQESDMLPLWMLSKQADGSVLGFTPAWVIAYTVPGSSGQLAYNIQSQFTGNLNLVDFRADRYEIDSALTVNWDADTQEWIPHPPESTTFDNTYHYDFVISMTGSGYNVGDVLTISGTTVGGTTPANDITFVVNTVSNTGSILSAFASGTANLMSAGGEYVDVIGNGGHGTGAEFTITVVPGVETVFDYNSVVFNAPADINTNTDAYDKYVMFPKRNIIDSVSTVGPQLVLWVNDQYSGYNWTNDTGGQVPWINNG